MLAIIADFPRATTSLFFNAKRQTCLRDGKTLKVVFSTKFCRVCDKQVIASALVQLRINFTCIFKDSLALPCLALPYLTSITTLTGTVLLSVVLLYN